VLEAQSAVLAGLLLDVQRASANHFKTATPAHSQQDPLVLLPQPLVVSHHPGGDSPLGNVLRCPSVMPSSLLVLVSSWSVVDKGLVMVPLIFMADMASAPVVQSKSKWLEVSNGGLDQICSGEAERIENIFEGWTLESTPNQQYSVSISQG
jgi:hypothetical protein